MEKPLELLEKNFHYENDRNIINESLNVFNNFIKTNPQIELKSNLTNNLLDFMFNNDNENYNEEDAEYDEEIESKKNFIEKIKDGINQEVRKNLKQTLDLNDDKKN